MESKGQYKVAVIGGGEVGRAMVRLLINCEDKASFKVMHYDKDFEGAQNLDVKNLEDLHTKVMQNDIIVSALPFHLTEQVAKEVSEQGNKLYIDFTEDLVTGRSIVYNNAQADQGSIVIPHCGLAPGVVSMIAAHLARQLDEVTDIKIRVGALPISAENPLMYYRGWSTNGLVNEYLKEGERLYVGRLTPTMGLGGLETVTVEGRQYEAFNTSGGSGTLLRSILEDDVSKAKFNKFIEASYKTLRYPGHCEKMRFLLQDLKLPPDEVAAILDKRVPRTNQDVIVIYVEARGMLGNDFAVRSYNKHIYGSDGLTAIQRTTAGGGLIMLQYALYNLTDQGTKTARSEEVDLTELKDRFAFAPYAQ